MEYFDEIYINLLMDEQYSKSKIKILDFNGNIIKEYISIAEAVRETGVNSKSIRDAANGVQKHAGGYVWKYDNDENK